MKTPTENELEQLMHIYDPAKAHAYYMRVRQLTGRKKGSAQEQTKSKSGRRIEKNAAKARQKRELDAAIQNLERKLQKLEKLIKKKEHAEASENRKGKAKKERAAKENEKPKSAAEKAKAARESEKFRKKNQQSLKAKAKKDNKSGGGSSKGKTGAKKKDASVPELKSLATKVRGQIQVAKQKLAAL